MDRSLLFKRISSFRFALALFLLAVFFLGFISFPTYSASGRKNSVDVVVCKEQNAAVLKPHTFTKDNLILADGQDEKFYLHYIRFKPDDGNTTFRFTDYLSVLSAVQNLKPDGIFVHGNAEPTGDYWMALRNKNIIRHIYKNLTDFVGKRQGKNKVIGFKEHSADIAKLDVLLEYGGVVSDFDVFYIRGERIKEILKRKKAMTCYGDRDGYNIGLVAARKDSKLLWAWRRSYTDIYVNDWNFQQAFVAKYLSILYRDETYVLNWACNNPHPDRNLGQYFHQYGKINWTNSVAIHSYERWGGVVIAKPGDLYVAPLTTHKELLMTIYENRTLPPYDTKFVDELDPFMDD